MRFFQPGVVRRQLHMISPPAVEHVIRVQTGKWLNGYILIIADNIIVVKYKKSFSFYLIIN